MLNLTFGNLWKVTFRLLATCGKDLDDLDSFCEVSFGLCTTFGKDLQDLESFQMFPKSGLTSKSNIYRVGQKLPKANMVAFQTLATSFQKLKC